MLSAPVGTRTIPFYETYALEAYRYTAIYGTKEFGITLGGSRELLGHSEML